MLDAVGLDAALQINVQGGDAALAGLGIGGEVVGGEWAGRGVVLADDDAVRRVQVNLTGFGERFFGGELFFFGDFGSSRRFLRSGKSRGKTTIDNGGDDGDSQQKGG